MLSARLYSPVAMSNISEWAEKSGADIYFGIPIEKMNDDRFGRSLDAFFDQRHSILGAVALHVAEEFKIPLSELHYDPTHVLFEGAYNDAVKRDGVVREDGVRCNDTLEPAHITRGRGTDDAPQGARMIQVGLLTSELCGTCESSVQGAAGDSSVVSAFSEARGVAGVSDDDGIDDVLFAAAYVSSEHAGRCSSCGTEDDSVADPEATTAATTGWLNS